MTTANEIPKQIAIQLPPQFVLWLRQEILNISTEIATTNTAVTTLESETSDTVDTLTNEVALKAGTDHNHNLNDLVEKSYESLDDKPTIPDFEVVDVVADGPTAVAISAISCPTGADTIDRSAFNTSLSTLVTEINNLKDDIDSLTTVHDDLIDKLQAAGLMAT